MSQFTPSLSFISGISNAQNAVLTFDDNHDFLVNEVISIRVTKPYGMVQINNQQGKILAITSNTITVDIDSTNYEAFVTPVSLLGTTPPCVVPSSSGVDLNSPVPRTILEDAFDNEP